MTSIQFLLGHVGLGNSEHIYYTVHLRVAHQAGLYLIQGQREGNQGIVKTMTINIRTAIQDLVLLKA